MVVLERRGDSVLLERDGELGVLDGLVQDALAGRAIVAVVEGPAGIGKTRLLAEARGKARAAGFMVLAARASDFERDLPFGVVRQLFEPVLADGARWLSGSAAAAARVFEPPDDERAAGDPSFGILLRALLAHREHRRRAAAAAGDRRPALVRSGVVAVHRLPGAPARGSPGVRRDDAADRR